jgi:heme A synthase
MQKPRLGLLPIGGGVAMAGLLFLVMPDRRRRWTTLLGAIVLMAAVGFSAGCGGGTVQTPSNPGTTAGTYTVTVTGTASGATAATTTVSVTVQ